MIKSLNPPVRTWLILTAGLFAPSALLSQSRSELDSIVSRFFAETRPTGLAVGVIPNRGFRYVSTRGMAQRGTSRKIGASTVFHLASITKTFTGIAVMQLVDRGAFALDDPVSRHLPFALEDSRYRDITIRQLLNHSSGLPHAETYNWDKPQTGDSALANYVRSISSLRLLFRPGDRWSYSDIGYEILGALVAKASRMSFEEYVDRNILRPVGMKNSTLLLTSVNKANLAAPHTPDSSGGAVVSAVYPYNREHAPSSTMHADIRDALLWAETLLPSGTSKTRAILPRTVIEEMWRPTLSIELPEGAIAGIPHRLAIGLTFFTWKIGGHRVIWHGGDDLGFSTSLMMAPDDGVAVVVLSNQRLVPVHKLASSLLAVALQAQR